MVAVILIFGQSLQAENEVEPVSAQSVWDNDSRKAGYYFLEAWLAMQRGDSGSYYELLKRASELNPDNSAVNYYKGYCKLFLAKSDSAHDEAFALMKSHLLVHPEDVIEARRYAMLNIKLGRFDEASDTYRRILKEFPRYTDDKYALARSLTMGKHFGDAIAVYDSLEVSEGITPQISMQKINLYLSLNDTTNALREARRLYETAPNALSNNDIMGHVYQHVGMLDSAYVYYDRMEKIDPNSADAALAKVAYYYEKKDSVQMDKHMYRALTNENMPIEQKVDELTRYIRTMYQDGDSSQRVVNLFNVILSQHPHEAAVRRLFGAYLSDKKDFNGASEQLSYALDIEPTNIDDWKNLMVVNMLGKNYDKALSAAEKALEYNPADIQLLMYIPLIYTQLKQYGKAVETCEIALHNVDSLDTQMQSDIYGMMGDAYHAAGDTLKAFNIYDKALELYPGNPGVLNNYAFFLACGNKELDKAEKMSSEAVRAEPENVSYLDTYAWVFFKKRNLDLAKLYMEQALKYSQEPSAEMYEHYGDILFFIGDPAKANEQWKKALELDPENKILNEKVKKQTYVYE